MKALCKEQTDIQAVIHRKYSPQAVTFKSCTCAYLNRPGTFDPMAFVIISAKRGMLRFDMAYLNPHKTFSFKGMV